ncbi:MAG: DNA recombination protein RmuC [Campylobacterales bacterium]
MELGSLIGGVLLMGVGFGGGYWIGKRGEKRCLKGLKGIEEREKELELKLREVHVVKERLERELEMERERGEAREREWKGERERLYRELQSRELKIGELEGKTAQLEQESRELRDRWTEELERIRLEFQRLGREVIREQLKGGEEGLNQLLTPFSEQLDRLRRELEQLKGEELQLIGGLESRLREMVELNSRLSIEAEKLTQLLTKSPTAKGGFGEVTLARLLELSGIPEGKGYQLQPHYQRGGEGYRPDAILFFPKGRAIVIDSKFPMASYQRYLEAKDKRERERARQGILKTLRGMIDNLAKKEYQNLVPGSPALTLLFLPVEGLFQLVSEEPELVEYGIRKRVLIVSPLSLLPALLSLEQLWRLEGQLERFRQLEQIVEKIYNEGRLVGEKVERIGKGLETAQKGYQELLMRIGPTKRKNLFHLLEELREMAGILPGKRIPKKLLEEG